MTCYHISVLSMIVIASFSNFPVGRPGLIMNSPSIVLTNSGSVLSVLLSVTLLWPGKIISKKSIVKHFLGPHCMLLRPIHTDREQGLSRAKNAPSVESFLASLVVLSLSM